MNKRLFSAAASMFLLGGVMAAAETQTHYVSPSSFTEVPPYLSFDTASHTIQPAIDISHNGDTVLVSVTTYFLAHQLVVTNGIVLRSTIAKDVILDSVSTTGRVRTISRSDAVVDGFTIKNGDQPNDSGGGVLISTGKLVNCWVVSNGTSLSGAGVWIKDSGEVTGCRIEYNSGDMFGGGVLCESGGLVSNCVINDNFVHGGWGGGVACNDGGSVVCSLISNNMGHTKGGGVFLYGDALADQCTIVSNTSDSGGGVYLMGGGLVERCLVINNLSSNNGGGIFLDQGGVVTNSRIFGNTATNSGGGIYVDQGGDVINCLVSTNIALGYWSIGCGKGGGVYLNQLGHVRRCTLANNYANDRGGGVYIASQGVVESCVIQSNAAAYYGGGVNCDQGGDVLYCTIVGNHAPGNGGGGLYANNGGYVAGTIIWDNTAAYSDNVLRDGAGDQFYYCCTTPMLSVGSDNISDDPQFRGPGDFRLTSGSLCIDSAGLLHVPDRRGVVRALEGNRDEPAYDDIGAYEYIDPTWDTDGDGQGDRMEVFAGTDPTDPESNMRMVRPSDVGASIRIPWASVAGKTYMVKRSLNLMNGFTDTVKSNIVATPPDNVYTGALLSGIGPCMYQIELQDAGDVGPLDD
jgi:predicted outer membrane repeat protein